MIIRTNVKTLKALLGVAAKNDVRYYLNSVYADTVKRVLVATDGHAMAIVRPEGFETGDESKPVIIPRDRLEAALRGAKGDVFISATEITTGADRFPFASIDARYPDWQRVTPVRSGMADAEIGQFNAGYLHTLAKFLSACSDGRSENLECQVTHNGADGAAVVTHHAALNAFGVVMPFRVKNEVSNELWSEVTRPI